MNLLMKMGVRYVSDRLEEPSSWAAITASLATALHFAPGNGFTHAFIAFGVAASTLFAVLLKEGASK